MKIRASTLDDVLHETFERLLRTGRLVTDATKGTNVEASGAIIELTNPRSRMSLSEARNFLLFGCLGEFLWYLSGDNSLSFIRHYIPTYPADNEGAKTLRAAYGPRLRNAHRNKLRWIIEILRKKPSTRRAVIPLYSDKDTYTKLSEVPCTCTLQFLLRNDRLEMLTHMRSNDAYVGLPGDVFAFTMIQELVARSLNVEIGIYKHLVGSLHLYEADWPRAKRFLAEDWQTKCSMPLMPLGDQFGNLAIVQKLEEALRNGDNPPTPPSLPAYWQDIAQLLRIHKADVEKAPSRVINRLRKAMRSDAYDPYIETKRRRAQKREQTCQGTLFPL